jgi:hypothetical protein
MGLSSKKISQNAFESDEHQALSLLTGRARRKTHHWIIYFLVIPKEGYPDFIKFFDSLKDKQALLSRDELQTVWEESARDNISEFDEFADF